MTIFRTVFLALQIGASCISLSQPSQAPIQSTSLPAPPDLPNPMLLLPSEGGGVIVKSIQDFPPSMRGGFEQGLKGKKGTFKATVAYEDAVSASSSSMLEYWDLGREPNDASQRIAKAIVESARARSIGVTERDFSFALSDVRSSILDKMRFLGLLPSGVTSQRPWNTAMRVYLDQHNNIYTLQERDVSSGSSFFIKERMNVSVNGRPGTMVRSQSMDAAASWTLLWIWNNRINELDVHCKKGECVAPEQLLKIASSIRFVEGRE